MASQILGEDDLHGWIKQGNLIAPFIVQLVRAGHNALGFVERPQSNFTPLSLSTCPQADPAPAGQNTSSPPQDTEAPAPLTPVDPASHQRRRSFTGARHT
jgi:hypothetical protein